MASGRERGVPFIVVEELKNAIRRLQAIAAKGKVTQGHPLRPSHQVHQPITAIEDHRAQPVNRAKGEEYSRKSSARLA